VKILHVIPALAPRYGGPSAAAIGMCRALGEAGVGTLMATTDADGSHRLPVPLGEPTTFEGVDVVFFRRRLGEAFKWAVGMRAWLDAHVREFDLVHVHAVFSHTSIAAGGACRKAGVPYMVRPLGTLDPWSLARKPKRKAWLLRMGGRDLLTGAAAMHYTTNEEGRLAESAVPRLPAGVVVPIGIDDGLFAPLSLSPRQESHPYVLFLGRLDEKKCTDVLLRAFHDVAADARLDGWRLVVAGDGTPAYVAGLKALGAHGASADRIVFRGWVNGPEKVALLAGAGLFALPSHQENFGISVVEAMAAGVPVVVSPGVNLAPDIASANAGWVADRDPAVLANALRAAMEDDTERRRRGAAAREFAERFRWPLVAGQLKSMYESLSVPQPVARSL
jgi:glycosyltransferase involved in cell wall biosynthesis